MKHSNKNNKDLRSFLKDINQNKSYLLMLLPGTLFLLAFNYLPMLGVLIAFKRVDYTKGFLRSDWVGFKNFEFFLKTPDAFRITRNTVLYNVAFIVLGLIISVFCAIALSELLNRMLAKFYQTAMFLPYFLSWIVVSYLVFSFLHADYGVVNTVFMKALGKEGKNWYVERGVWPFILVFLNLWKLTGYNSVIYLAALTGINKEYYEAAAIDGASKWQQITRITIPKLMPLMTILTILAVGRIFNADFGLFYTVTLKLGEGMLKPVADVIDTYVFNSLINIGDIGMASAAGLYQAIVGFILVISANFIVRKIDYESSLF